MLGRSFDPQPAEWVKDPALPHLQSRSKLWLGFDPWYGNSICLEVAKKEKKRKKRTSSQRLILFFFGVEIKTTSVGKRLVWEQPISELKCNNGYYNRSMITLINSKLETNA